MSLAGTPLPYGLRDVKITPYLDQGATKLGSPLDLPNSRTLSFSEAEEFTELRGDDRVVTTRGQGPSVEWELESGGLPLEVVQAISGATLAETGVSPGMTKRLVKKATDARPFFRIEGQAISDSGGDVHCILDRCRVTGNIEGEFTDGEFFLTSGSGVALPSLIEGREDVLYEFVQNELPTPIEVDTIVAEGAVAGLPGSFTPVGSPRPADLAALADVEANPQTAWENGQRVETADGQVAYWDGTEWVLGAAPAA